MAWNALCQCSPSPQQWTAQHRAAHFWREDTTAWLALQAMMVAEARGSLVLTQQAPVAGNRPHAAHLALTASALSSCGVWQPALHGVLATRWLLVCMFL